MTKPKSASAAKAKSEKKSAPKKPSVKAKASEPKRAAAPKLGSDQFKCPAEAEVVALVRRLKGAAKTAAEAAGEMGEMIAKACETKHFDRKALSIVRGLESMSDNKLSVTLPHLLMYIDALELHKRSERQGQLIEDPAVAKAKKKAGSKKGEMDEGGEGEGGGEIDAPELQKMPEAEASDFKPLH